MAEHLKAIAAMLRAPRQTGTRSNAHVLRNRTRLADNAVVGSLNLRPTFCSLLMGIPIDLLGHGSQPRPHPPASGVQGRSLSEGAVVASTGPVCRLEVLASVGARRSRTSSLRKDTRLSRWVHSLGAAECGQINETSSPAKLIKREYHEARNYGTVPSART